MKQEKKTRWVFVFFQKYGKFLNISIGHFIKHKPVISDEWNTYSKQANASWWTIYCFLVRL